MAEMRIGTNAHGFNVHIGRLSVNLRQMNGVLWIELVGDNYKPPFASIRVDEEGAEMWRGDDDKATAETLYKRSEDPHRLRP